MQLMQISKPSFLLVNKIDIGSQVCQSKTCNLANALLVIDECRKEISNLGDCYSVSKIRVCEMCAPSHTFEHLAHLAHAFIQNVCLSQNRVHLYIKCARLLYTCAPCTPLYKMGVPFTKPCAPYVKCACLLRAFHKTN